LIEAFYKELRILGLIIVNPHNPLREKIKALNLEQKLNANDVLLITIEPLHSSVEVNR